MEEKTVKLIGLTGGIGAGKSVVARVLRTKGFEVYDCDTEARRLMEEGDMKDRITDRFGASCYLPDGKLDRKYLASKIFADEEQRRWLNSLVHDAVRRDIREWGKGKDMAFVESAILFTSGLDKMCEGIWLVVAPEEIRYSRAILRGGIGETDLRKRMEAQQHEFDALPSNKVKIIDNSGSVSLLEQIDQLLKLIK